MSAADVDSVAAEVASLQGLNIDQLRQVWRRRFGIPPYLRSGDVLRRCLAEKIQTQAMGRLADVDARITVLVRNYARSGSVRTPRADLRPGTVLLREYGDKAHRVEVTAEGFLFEGQTFRSLTRIAFQITGTRWNGPAFFGLRPGEVAR